MDLSHEQYEELKEKGIVTVSPDKIKTLKEMMDALKETAPSLLPNDSPIDLTEESMEKLAEKILGKLYFTLSGDCIEEMADAVARRINGSRWRTDKPLEKGVYIVTSVTDKAETWAVRYDPKENAWPKTFKAWMELPKPWSEA